MKKTDILLDLFHDVQVAHDVEKEEKEEIKQGPVEIKKSKKLDVEQKEGEEEITLWTLAKYGLAGTGIAFLFYHLFLSKRRKKHREPDMQEMMTFMMYQTMMMQMQQMQEKYGNNEKLAT